MIKKLFALLGVLFAGITVVFAQNPQAGFSYSLDNGQTFQPVADGNSINICIGTTLYLQNTSNPGVLDSICYSITNGTPFTDDCDHAYIINGMYVGVSFNTAGNATIKQKVTDYKGNTGTITLNLKVSNVYPVAQFANIAPQCGSATFNFMSSSTAGGAGAAITSYLWMFAGSSTTSSTAINPSIVFDRAFGNGLSQPYAVSLTVTNNLGCSNTYTQNIAINQIPNDSITSSNAGSATQTVSGYQFPSNIFTICSSTDSIIKFINSSTTTATNTFYKIIWGNKSPNFSNTSWAASDTLRQPYPQGYDTLTITETGQNGCTNTKLYTIFRGQTPANGLQIPQTKPICIGQSISFPIGSQWQTNSPGTVYDIRLYESPVFDTIIHQEDLASLHDTITHVFNQSSCGIDDLGYQPYYGGSGFTNGFNIYCGAINACATQPEIAGIVYVSGLPTVLVSAPPSVCDSSVVSLGDSSDWSGTYPCSASSKQNSSQIWQITRPLGGEIQIISGDTGSISTGVAGKSPLVVKFIGKGTYKIRLYVKSTDPNTPICLQDYANNLKDITICVRNTPFAKFTLDKKSACSPYTFTASQLPDTTISCGGDAVSWTVNPLAYCPGSQPNVNIDTGTSSQKALINVSQPGQYEIVLTVTSIGGGCSNQFRDTVTLYGPPSLSPITISPYNAICSGDSIQASVTVDSCFTPGPLSYRWIFKGAGGAKSDTINGLAPPYITYNKPSPPDLDTIVFTALPKSCGAVSDTALLTVASKPLLNKVKAKTTCSGMSVNIALTSPQDPAVNYIWAGTVLSGDASNITANGSGNAITDMPVCTIKSVVEYDVTGFFSGGSCQSDVLKIFDTILAVDSAHAGPNQFLCKGVTSAIMAATAPATGKGTWGLVENLPVTYSNIHSPTATVKGLRTDTVYTFIWTISGTGLQCVDSSDTVRISLDTIVNVVDTPHTICPGQQPVITAQQPSGGDIQVPYSFDWQQSTNGVTYNDVPASYAATLNTLGLPPTSSNGYYRRIIISGSCADTSNAVPVVVVTENPVPSFTPVDTSGCVPPNGSLPVTFVNTTLDKNKFTYFWQFGNGSTSTLVNPGTVKFGTTISGYGDSIYYDTLTVTNGCVTATFTGIDTVKSLSPVLFSANTSIGCSSGPITFTNLSVAANPQSHYSWNFGDSLPYPSNSQTVQHAYHNGPPTTYSVTLVGTNVCGTDTSQPLLITIDSVNIGLYVNINSTEKYICADDTVHFQNKSSGATSFAWNFGDGTHVTTTSNIETVAHEYKNAGVYYDTVCAINACADTCTNDSIKVGVKPLASFTVAPDSVCTGSSVQFNNTSTPMNDPGVIFIWKFGDGGIDNTDISPAHAYTSVGTDTARLIAERQFLPGFPAGFGCPDSALAVVYIGQATGTLQYTPDSVCLGGQQAVTLTVTSNNSTLYNFEFGDNSNLVTGNNVVTHTYTQPGKYLPFVTLTGFGGKCSTTVTGTDSVLVDTIHAAFTIDSIPLCDSTKLIFTSNSYAYFGVENYAWVINGKQYATNPVLQAVNSTTGINATLTVTGNSGCTTQTSQQLGVYVHQTPSGSIAVNSNTCAGQTVSFSAIAFCNDPITLYGWAFANGDRPFGQTVTAIFAQPGIYADTAIATSSFGCADTIVSAVTIKTTPAITITPLDSVILCRGDTTLLNASGDSIVAWTWNPVGGLGCSTCGSTTAYPSTPTLYTVTGTNSAGCTNTDSVQVNVIQPFTVTATPGNISICLPADSLQKIQFFASGATNYTWSPTTWLNSSTVYNPVVNVPDTALQTSGTFVYTVTGYDQYHCFAETAGITLGIGLTPVVTFNPGDTGVAGRVDTLYPLEALNGPFSSFNWTVNGPGVINPISKIGDTVQLTINGDITVYITAVTNYGCTVTDTLYYTSFCNQGEQVYIPNAFSPDGDGINDVFIVQGKGIIVEELKVFNRWGQVVFDGGSNVAPNIPAYGWNGTLNGKPVNDDVYVYVAKLRCTASNISFFAKGNVTLIRVRR